MSNELDALAGVAAAADAGAIEADNVGQQQEGGEVVPAGPDYGHEATGAVDMFTGLLVGYAPAAADIWTPEAKQRTAAALVPVMEKYGFSFGNLPPELTFVVVAGPLLWQSARVVGNQAAKDKAQAQAKAQERKPDGIAAAAAAPGGYETAPAPAVHPQTALYK
jgi:hypothetical protein